MDIIYTLLADGTSDRVLMPLIRWLLEEHLGDIAVQGHWADFRFVKRRPIALDERINKALELYPCDLLFVHRDAERDRPEARYDEISAALIRLQGRGLRLPAICVVPVRMQEAWLLIDESAIRTAAGNPNGRVRLAMPRVREIEEIPDPKQLLYDLLKQASERRGRRLAKLHLAALRYRVADLIEDPSRLRELPAFARLEADVRAYCRA